MIETLTANLSARHPWYSTSLTTSRCGFVRSKTGRAGNALRPRRVRASASLPFSNESGNNKQGTIKDCVTWMRDTCFLFHLMFNCTCYKFLFDSPLVRGCSYRNDSNDANHRGLASFTQPFLPLLVLQDKKTFSLSVSVSASPTLS